MAILQNIADVEPFFPGELPSHEKFTEEFTQKVNTLITNHVIVNDATELLLQGVSGGAEQAKLTFALASAPDGWTRDLSFTTDTLLRVTDGSTLPPGASPTATGGSEGGSWTITGTTTVAETDHTHTMNAHVHDMSHSHTGGSHTHPSPAHTHLHGNHSHSISSGSQVIQQSGDSNQDHSGDINSIPPGVSVARLHVHTTTIHSHGGTTSAVNPSSAENGGFFETAASDSLIGSASPGNTGGNSSTSGTGGSHNHTPSHDGSFRPKYLNMIVCSKD